jgi:hypothetical protein
MCRTFWPFTLRTLQDHLGQNLQDKYAERRDLSTQKAHIPSTLPVASQVSELLQVSLGCGVATCAHHDDVILGSDLIHGGRE